MPPQRRQLCVDIDNVVAHTDKVFRALIRSMSGGRVCLEYEDIREFNYYDCKDAGGNGISKDEWPSIHEAFSRPEILRTVEPSHEAMHALNDLSRDFEIDIVTSRLPQAKEPTENWLVQHSMPFDQLLFVGHRQKHAGSHAFFAAVEDDYDQAVAFAAKKIPCILICHPWNRTKEPREGIQWANSWSQVATILRSKLPQ